MVQWIRVEPVQRFLQSRRQLVHQHLVSIGRTDWYVLRTRQKINSGKPYLCTTHAKLTWRNPDDLSYFSRFCESYSTNTASGSIGSSSISTATPAPATTCTDQFFACIDDSGCSNGNVCRKGPNQPVGNCYCPIATSATPSASTPDITSSSTPTPSPSCTNQFFACIDDSGCSNGNVCRKAANQPVGNCYCPSIPITTSGSVLIPLSTVVSQSPSPSANGTMTTRTGPATPLAPTASTTSSFNGASRPQAAVGLMGILAAGVVALL